MLGLHRHEHDLMTKATAMRESGRTTDQFIIKRFPAWWPHGQRFQGRQICPSMLDEWLALRQADREEAASLKASTVIASATMRPTVNSSAPNYVLC